MEVHRLLRIEGIRHNTYLYHINDGFYYYFNNETFTTLYFRCARGGLGCGGRAVMQLGHPLRHTQLHNHLPEPSLIDFLAARRRIVNRAMEMTYVSFVEIVEEERRRLNNNRTLRSQLTYRRLRGAMQRARASVFPPIPASLHDVTAILQDPVWQSLSMTHDMEDSIYGGSATARDGTHHVLFISRRCLAVLREVPIIFADGTFYISPSVESCYQVFVIVSIWGHTVIPLAWCLMQSKSEHAYVAVLLLLRSRLLQWQFTKVVCDFEDAMINAFSKVFAVEVQGCLFHAVHAMASWSRSHITSRVLNQHPEVQGIIYLCCALPLLPHHLLQRGLNTIGVYALTLGAYLYNIARPFLEYVQVHWLNHVNRGRTMSVFGSEHRTDNPSECNNRRMRNRIRVHHPYIYNLIYHFKNFEDTTIDDILSLRRGLIPNRHRAVTAINNDAHIQAITRILLQNAVPTDQQIMDFLYSASFSLQNVVEDAINLQDLQPPARH